MNISVSGETWYVQSHGENKIKKKKKLNQTEEVQMVYFKNT